MWGKHYESMYEGSMYGAGVAVFAVWGYVISHTRKGRVELNPRKLADTLGGKQEEIIKAIQFLMDPDKESRFKEHGGRRLLKEGEFQYQVPSWEYYQLIRNEDDRREYNKRKQQESRAKKKGPSATERKFCAAVDRGDEEEANRLCAPGVAERIDQDGEPVSPAGQGEEGA